MIVVITTCYKYKSIWPISITLLKKYWPDCPYEIIFLTDSKDDKDYSFNFHCIGKDLGWSSNLKEFLKKTKSTKIFLAVEDLLLKDKVNTDLFLKAQEYIDKYNLGSVRLEPYHRQTKYGLLDWIDIDFGIINPNDSYSITGQPTIWDKDTLLSLLIDGENPWQFEIDGSKRANKISKKLISLKEGKERPYPYIYGLKRGVYTSEALDFIKKENLSAFVQEIK